MANYIVEIQVQSSYYTEVEIEASSEEEAESKARESNYADACELCDHAHSGFCTQDWLMRMILMNKKRYWVSTDEEWFSHSCEAESPIEAVKSFLWCSGQEVESDETIYVGEDDPLEIKLDAMNILQNLSENGLSDEILPDTAEQWDAKLFSNMTAIEELNEELNIVFKQWLIKNNIPTSLGCITNIKEFSIGDIEVE